jgi:hypothetical protein
VDEDDDNFDYLDVNTDLSNAIADDWPGYLISTPAASISPELY